jgi:hypothetical protein
MYISVYIYIYISIYIYIHLEGYVYIYTYLGASGGVLSGRMSADMKSCVFDSLDLIAGT